MKIFRDGIPQEYKVPTDVMKMAENGYLLSNKEYLAGTATANDARLGKVWQVSVSRMPRGSETPSSILINGASIEDDRQLAEIFLIEEAWRILLLQRKNLLKKGGILASPRLEGVNVKRDAIRETVKTARTIGGDELVQEYSVINLRQANEYLERVRGIRHVGERAAVQVSITRELFNEVFGCQMFIGAKKRASNA